MHVVHGAGTFAKVQHGGQTAGNVFLGPLDRGVQVIAFGQIGGDGAGQGAAGAVGVGVVDALPTEPLPAAVPPEQVVGIIDLVPALAEDGTAVVPGMSAPGEYAVMVCRYSDRQGDFDNNGVLDIYDAVALLRYSVGLESGENLQLIDLNGDGMVNCADASMVLRWVVGLSA